MSTATLSRSRPRGVLRHSAWDALLVALAAGHGALLLALPAAPVEGTAPAEDPAAPAHSDPEEHAGAPRLQVHQQVSPNFGSPVRRWLRG